MSVLARVRKSTRTNAGLRDVDTQRSIRVAPQKSISSFVYEARGEITWGFAQWPTHHYRLDVIARITRTTAGPRSPCRLNCFETMSLTEGDHQI
jgi:hypothetical protein